MTIDAKIDEYLDLLNWINDRVGDEAVAACILQEVARDRRVYATRARVERHAYRRMDEPSAVRAR